MNWLWSKCKNCGDIRRNVGGGKGFPIYQDCKICDSIKLEYGHESIDPA